MNVERITSLSARDRDALYRLYRDEWWTADRERADVDAILDGSDEVVGLRDVETGGLVAFARVLTDYARKALVFDVIVAEPHRGVGLGGRLLDEIVGHPALEGVQHLELYCMAGLVPFYERWGFTEDLDGLRLLRRA